MFGSKVIEISDKKPSIPAVTDKNFVVHSILNTCEIKRRSAKLSVKLVLDGTERYRVDNKPFNVNSGEFLLIEPKQELHISFNEKKQVEGICFYFDENYFKQAIALQNQKHDWGMERSWTENVQPFSFLCKNYALGNGTFGVYLKKVAQRIKSEPQVYLSEDFFMDFALKLVEHQTGVSAEMNKLLSLKLSTRKELYCRVSLAKEYLHQQAWDEQISIQELAAIATLSEVQLHRAFKQVFGMTPHQYILQLKLNRAFDLIQINKLSLTEIGLKLGFADLPTFSKAFKKKYGLAPSAIQK